VTENDSRDENIVAYYDLKKAPITFDFCQFIAAASAFARRSGRLMDLVILADAYRQRSTREHTYSLVERRWRIWNLLSDIAEIVPNIERFEIIHRPISDIAIESYPRGYNPIYNPNIPYQFSHANKLHALGADVQVFRPTEYAVQAAKCLLPDTTDPIVSFTLRRAAFESTRDSDLEQWYAFYQALRSKGFQPIIIPDQDDVLGDRSIHKWDWPVIDAAAMSVNLRLGIYSVTASNYVTNSGLSCVFIYSKAPFIWTKVVVENSRVATESYFERVGKLKWGEKYPWLQDNQHMVWEPDTLETLLDTINLIDVK